MPQYIEKYMDTECIFIWNVLGPLSRLESYSDPDSWDSHAERFYNRVMTYAPPAVQLSDWLDGIYLQSKTLDFWWDDQAYMTCKQAVIEHHIALNLQQVAAFEMAL